MMGNLPGAVYPDEKINALCVENAKLKHRIFILEEKLLEIQAHCALGKFPCSAALGIRDLALPG